METLMIIDGNGLLYRGFYAIPILTTNEGKFTNAVYAFTRFLVKAIEDYKPDYLVVAFDYGKKTFRNELYADYKGTRKQTPVELVPQFPMLKELLKTMGIAYVEKEGIEADDIIATISKRFPDLKKIIISGDGDSFQLVDENTSIYFTKKGLSEIKIINEEVLKAEYGITPAQVVDLKALKGDASDNIPGVAGVGDKTAKSLIEEYGTLDNIYNNINEISARVSNKLIIDKENAYLSYKLAKNVIDESLELNLSDFKYSLPFSDEVRQMFKRLEFHSFGRRTTLFEKGTSKTLNESAKPITLKSEFDDFCAKIKRLSELAIDFDGETLFLATDNIFCKIAKNEIDSNFDFNEVLQWLKTIFEDEAKTKIIFDYKSYLYKLQGLAIDFKNIFDCAIAKYLLESTLKNYTIASLCEEYDNLNVAQTLYTAKSDMLEKMKKLDLLYLFYEVELPLCKVLFDMEINGIKIDVDKLKEYDKQLEMEKEQTEAEIFAISGHEFNIKAPSQVAEVLFGELKLPNPNGKKASTDIDTLNAIKDYSPIVELIIKYRKILKWKNTYIESYIKFQKNGFIHSEFNQMATDSGRLSSSNPNLQNIPVRDSEATFIREVFVSRFKDGLITSFDYNQMELRLMAHFSGDPYMLKAFNEERDIHRATASIIYNVNEEDVTKEQRQRAKVVNFGVMYGQGKFGLSKELGCKIVEAEKFIDYYFTSFPKVAEYIKGAIAKARENDNTAVTMFNRRRHIVELAVESRNLVMFGERVAINMPLQGTVSDIIKIAMIRVAKMLKDENFESKLVLQIHDELVFDTKPEELERLKVKVKDIMENVVKLSLPLSVSVNVGKNFNK